MEMLMEWYVFNVAVVVVDDTVYTLANRKWKSWLHYDKIVQNVNHYNSNVLTKLAVRAELAN